MNYFAQRRQALVKDLKRDNFDALVISNPVNVTYLTGFTGDSSFVLASPKTTVLVSDSRYEAQIAEECPDLETVIRGHDKTTEEALGETITKTKYESIGLESGHATLAFVEKLKNATTKCTFAGAGAKVEELRVIKDAMELELIREAVRIAERGFGMFRAMLRETDTEKDMADAMENYVRRAGGTTTAFSVIAAVGDRGALPHAVPTGRTMAEGSKLLLDWGAVYKGYRADLTRTFRSPFAMTPNRKNRQERVGHDFEKVYDIVLKAQQAAIDMIREGVAARDVDGAARKVINDAGYGDHFNHGLGHGLGLETHEGPRVRTNSDDTLLSGMVVTVEPGIYIPGWGGIRIEDDVLVRRDGCTLLSSLPRELDALEKLF